MFKLAKFILIITLLLTVSLVSGYAYLQYQLKNLPITNLNYAIHQIGYKQIEFSQLSFTLLEPELDVHLQHIKLNWHWSDLFSPSIDLLSLKQGKLTLKHWPNSSNQTSVPKLSLPKQWQLPAAIPKNIAINQLQLQLPCAEQFCSYSLNAIITIHQQQLDYQIQLADIVNPSLVRGQVAGYINTANDLPSIYTDVTIDDTISLALQQQFSQTAEQLNSNSNLQLTAKPPSAWLQQQLNLWQLSLPPSALEQFTAPINISSQAQLYLPLPLDTAKLVQQLSGNWQFNADLPSEFNIPNVGAIKGNLTAQLSLNQGDISNYQLQSALQLNQLQFGNSFKQYGVDIDDIFLELNADSSSQPSLAALPIVANIKTTGATQAKINSKIVINATEDYSVQLTEVKLQLQQAQLNYKLANNEYINLDQLKIDSEFSGFWQASKWQLDLSQLNATANQLQLSDISAQQLMLKLQPSHFSSQQALSIDSQFKLDIANLQHPELITQAWQYQAKISGNLNNLSLNAKLENAANLVINHQGTYNPEQIKINWQLDEIFLLASNPLAASLVQWPALLEINRGKILAKGKLSLSPHQTLLVADLTLNDLSGIYDRGIFKALTAEIALGYNNDNFTLDVQQAKLAEFSQGIELGPILLSANYTAKNNNILNGILDLQYLNIRAMGGKITADPIQLDLTKQQQIIKLQLDKIDLAKVLQQHPTSDLTGNGLISGTIPLLICNNGIRVDKGHIAAESPGGELQYRPAAASSMAAGNQSMKVVLDALDNFHYSVLSSNVSYDAAGKLNLALSIQGNNPSFEQGRAINFNINLEEDLPALITSMQLNSEISEKIKRRVQQRLQQKAAKASNGESP